VNGVEPAAGLVYQFPDLDVAEPGIGQHGAEAGRLDVGPGEAVDDPMSVLPHELQTALLH
jgi:hypothetical protein